MSFLVLTNLDTISCAWWTNINICCSSNQNSNLCKRLIHASWNFKNKEARRGWACSKKKKTFKPIYFQISYLPHFLFVLNNLKNYGNTIWSFRKPFWSEKTIKWHPNIISTIMQTGHMCEPTSCHDPFHLIKTYLVHSFINLMIVVA